MPATSPARRASTPPPLCEGKKERGRRRGGRDWRGRAHSRAGSSLPPPSFLPSWETELCQWGNGSFVVARSLARQLARLDAHGGGRKEGGGRRRPLGWALEWRSLARGNVAACFGRRRRRTQRTEGRRTAHTSNADLNERKILADQAGGRPRRLNRTGDERVTCGGDDQEG